MKARSTLILLGLILLIPVLLVVGGLTWVTLSGHFIVYHQLDQEISLWQLPSGCSITSKDETAAGIDTQEALIANIYCKNQTVGQIHDSLVEMLQRRNYHITQDYLVGSGPGYLGSFSMESVKFSAEIDMGDATFTSSAAVREESKKTFTLTLMK
jgi:hypothetical protein